MWFFVFSINFARTREGRPARRKLTEFLVKSKETLVTDPAAIFFVFQVNISCKTTSIILYFKYASFSVVTRKKRQNTNPHPDGNFFDDRFGLGILRDGYFCVFQARADLESRATGRPSLHATHVRRSPRALRHLRARQTENAKKVRLFCGLIVISRFWKSHVCKDPNFCQLFGSFVVSVYLVNFSSFCSLTGILFYSSCIS